MGGIATYLFSLGAKRRARVALVALPFALAGLGANAALAGASAGYRLTVTPAKVTPGGRVTIYTTPRMRCSIRLTVAGKRFSHSMNYGWVQVTMPRTGVPGRVLVRVSCAGGVANGSFTVVKKK